MAAVRWTWVLAIAGAAEPDCVSAYRRTACGHDSTAPPVPECASAYGLRCGSPP